MSLMARLRRIEAGIEWLETEGMLRLCAAQIKLLQRKEQVEAHLARYPGHEGARTLAPYLGIEVPPLPKPPPPTPVVRPPPSPLAPAPSPPPPASAQPPPDERVRESSFADVTFADVVQRPPPSWPPPPPPVEWETHDIPEHMQIRPVTWRLRGPQDDDDWEDGGHDPYQALTEYDPLEEADD